MFEFVDCGWMRERFASLKPNWKESGWVCMVDQGQGFAHILPANDIGNLHEVTDECPCGPRVELLTDHPDTLPDVWLYVHHALDGRE